MVRNYIVCDNIEMQADTILNLTVFCPQHIPAGCHQGVWRGVRRGEGTDPSRKNWSFPWHAHPLCRIRGACGISGGPGHPAQGAVVSGSHPGLGCTEQTLDISALGPWLPPSKQAPPIQLRPSTHPGRFSLQSLQGVRRRGGLGQRWAHRGWAGWGHSRESCGGWWLWRSRLGRVLCSTRRTFHSACPRSLHCRGAGRERGGNHHWNNGTLLVLRGCNTHIEAWNLLSTENWLFE